MRIRVIYLRAHPFSDEVRDRRLDTIELDIGSDPVPDLEKVRAAIAANTGDEVIEIDDIVPLIEVAYDVQIKRVPVPDPPAHRPTIELRTVRAYATEQEIGDDVEAYARRRAGVVYLGLHDDDDGRHDGSYGQEVSRA